MNTTRTTRSSNIELLRIIAMIMIIAFHIIDHCVVEIQLTDLDSMARFNNGLFCSPAFYRNLLLPSAIMPMGPAGNAIFLLISGFYRVDPSKQFDLSGISLKLLTQTAFAAVFLTLFSFFCVFCSPGGFLKPLSIQVFNNMCWFVGYYFLVTLIARLFLNRYLLSWSRKEYLTFLLVLLTAAELGWSGRLMESAASGLRVLATGVFLYSLGGFIRRFRPFRRIHAIHLWLTILAMFLLVNFSFYNVTAVNIEAYLQKASEKPFVQTISKYPNYSMVVLVIGVCLFEIFLRIRVRQSRILNYIAASTFMIYLIHDNKFFYSLWNLQDWITPLYREPVFFLLRLFAWVFILFALGILLYTLYRVLGRGISRSLIHSGEDAPNA